MNNKQWDALWVNSTIATMQEGYGLVESAAIAVKDSKIAWLGLMCDLTDAPERSANEVHDAKGRCITPGLIDCHTHLVYAGNRAVEFEMRLEGATYEAIARAGGGIRSTVAATRAASEEELFQQSAVRARALIASGVTTVEIKSGYGLDLATELKMLRVAKRLGEELAITVRKTFLGAHTIPAEYQNNADDYINLVCHEMIPVIAAEKLADTVDVFCEKIAFNLEQTEKVFAAAEKYGLAIKCHAEQLSDSGSAELAAKYHALSADHLEFLSEQGAKHWRSRHCCCVIARRILFLRETKLPPIALLRKYQVPMACD